MDEMKLDDELRRALNVDPSPEFLARVRTRIANEPEPSRWHLAWVMVPIAASGVVVLALASSPWSRPEPATPIRAAAPPSRSPAPAPLVEPAPAVRGVRLQADRVRTAARADRSRAFPEVVVSEADKQAFESLLAAIREDTLPVRVRAEGEVDESLAPPPVEIDQLTIAPLQLARLE